MTDQQIKIEIARVLCVRFLNLKQATERHGLVVKFERPDLLAEMEQQSLCTAQPDRSAYRPSLGSFALLEDDDELYLRARQGYEIVVHCMRNLYCVEGTMKQYTFAEFEEYARKLYDRIDPALLQLGLYLSKDFGALSGFKVSDDQMTVESFGVSEHLITMRDPSVSWMQRVQAARDHNSQRTVPANSSPCAVEEEHYQLTETFDENSFWSLIHPAIVEQALPRFRAGHYADSVEAALKAVAQKIRDRTGLDDDGASLMNRAFSLQEPYLLLGDPRTVTGESIQKGYLLIFSGAMTGIRNPKVHGIVTIDERRCIHFLFLASLLADKVDEAADSN